MPNKISIEKISYGGWPNCLRLTNGIVDLIATTDVGPRILRFGFVGKRNEFKEFPEMLGKTGGLQWRAYGGHRLWYAPEHKTRTYFPDNFPIAHQWHAGTLRLIQSPEKTTGIQKEISLRLSPTAAGVTITHRIRNLGRRSIELAPWALSVMAEGGTAIIPLPPLGSHPKDLLPANRLTFWKYTDMSDPRWTWGNKYILLRQDSRTNKPQKIGANVSAGWAAYARAGHLFLKIFPYHPRSSYPDLGCNFETFTNHEMLEVETLGPLVMLKPKQSVLHFEHWALFQDVKPPTCDADVRKILSGIGGRRTLLQS